MSAWYKVCDGWVVGCIYIASICAVTCGWGRVKVLDAEGVSAFVST